LTNPKLLLSKQKKTFPTARLWKKANGFGRLLSSLAGFFFSFPTLPKQENSSFYFNRNAAQIVAFGEFCSFFEMLRATS